MIDIRITDHLLIPFGAKKYEIDTIRLVGVSTDGTYFSSPIPVGHIDLKAKAALRLDDLEYVVSWLVQYQDVRFRLVPLS